MYSFLCFDAVDFRRCNYFDLHTLKASSKNFLPNVTPNFLQKNGQSTEKNLSLTEPKVIAVIIMAILTYLFGIQSIYPTVISDRAADGALSVL